MVKKAHTQTDGTIKPRRSRKVLVIPPIVLLILVVIVLLFSNDPEKTLNELFGETPIIEMTSTFEFTKTPLKTALSDNSEGNNIPQDTWWFVYFTEPHSINSPQKYKGSIEEKLIELIRGARKTIHIASFEFNLPRVADALIEAEKKQVEVKWITDDENGIQADKEGLMLFSKMKKNGIDVKDDHRSALMHDKFWVFDDQIVWTGATNITVNGIYENNNNVIVIQSPDLALIFEDQFSDMWAGNFGPDSPSQVDQQNLIIDDTPIQVYFSPEDQAVKNLLPLINQAKKSIRIMAFSFTQEDLGNAIIERHKAGVDVMAVLETRGSETESSQLLEMWCAKIPVRQDGNPSSYHHKVFVIDNKIVITGSLNFSNNADESNNENVLVIVNPEIADPYLQEFDRTWSEANEPLFTRSDCP